MNLSHIHICWLAWPCAGDHAILINKWISKLVAYQKSLASWVTNEKGKWGMRREELSGSTSVVTQTGDKDKRSCPCTWRSNAWVRCHNIECLLDQATQQKSWPSVKESCHSEAACRKRNTKAQPPREVMSVADTSAGQDQVRLNEAFQTAPSQPQVRHRAAEGVLGVSA